MTFRIADLIKSTCKTLWHDLFSVGHFKNGLLEVDDDLAKAMLEKCRNEENPQPMFTSTLLGQSMQNARLLRCFDCEKNVNGICRLCSTCGSRPVAHKVRLSTETCPLNRWAQ